MLNQILATSYYSSSSSLSASEAAGAGVAIATIFGMMMLPVLIVAVVTIIGMWKVFEKAGVAGWKAIIPFYNSYLLTEISGQNGWLFLLIFVPGVGSLIWSILVSLKMAPAFGKETGFAIGLILLAPIFYCILGFGSAQYQLGGAAANNAQPAGPAPEAPQAPQDQGPAAQA